jgi:hypothetical protein
MNKIAVLCLAFTALLTFWSGAGAEIRCDPDLLALANKDVLSYQDRGDRCEGVYARNVAGSANVVLASLTSTFPDFSPHLVSVLHLSWLPPQSVGTVNLRASSLKYKLFYQMDTSQPGSTPRFDWSLALLKDVDVLRNELGLLAWTATLAGGINRTVYLPVAVEPSKSTADPTYSAAIEAVLVPSIEMDELDYWVSKYPASGTPVRVIDRSPVGNGFYPAERALKLALNVNPEPAFYSVNVVGKNAASGASVGTAFWFYHGR